MSDTPRTLETLTQALDLYGRIEDDAALLFLVRLAKNLEIELNAAKAENEAMLECLGALISWEPRQKDEGEREAYIIARMVFDKITHKQKKDANA